MAVAGLPALGAPSPASGAIAGIVTTRAAAPGPLRVTLDPEVCGTSLPDESIVRDDAGHLANVVVSVVGVTSAPPAEVLVANERCRFVPRVSLLRPKGTVKMTSHDPVLHTMHAAPAAGRALFNVSLPIPNLVLSRPIDRAGVVTLSCSTHSWMRGYLYVTTELSAVTGADGRFRLEDVPAGTHQLRIWHERLAGETVTTTVKHGAETAVTIEVK
jgi:hypothetical protein